MSNGVIIFNLKMMWTYPDGSERRLYDEIKSGRKTSEWRDFKRFWISRLLKQPKLAHIFKSELEGLNASVDITGGLKVGRAWFVESFPKGNLPRLEAIITGLVYHHDSGQFEIKFSDVTEVIH